MLDLPIAALPKVAGPREELDREAILTVVSGNIPLLHEIIDIFCAERPGGLDEIAGAIRAGDAEQLRQAAHALNGIAGNFRARSACAAARRLELMGRDGDLTGAEEVFVELTGAIHRLERGLLELKADTV